MKILGNRILIKRIKEEQKEGFNAVKVQDSFLYKGEVVLVGDGAIHSQTLLSTPVTNNINISDTVLFAKNLPYTESVDVDGEIMKIVRIEDILAVL